MVGFTGFKVLTRLLNLTSVTKIGQRYYNLVQVLHTVGNEKKLKITMKTTIFACPSPQYETGTVAATMGI